MQSERLSDYQDITSKFNEGCPKKFTGFNSSPFLKACTSLQYSACNPVRTVYYLRDELLVSNVLNNKDCVCLEYISKHQDSWKYNSWQEL